MERLDIVYDDFLAEVTHLKTNLNTISQLRSMWTNEENKYAKAFRIISI